MPSSKSKSGKTQQDVAIIANVAVKTVSLAIAGSDEVAVETKNNILKIAKEIGYIIHKRTYVVGLITPYISQISYSELIAFIREMANSYGYTVLITESSGNPKIEKNLIQQLHKQKIDGLLLISPRISLNEIEKFSNSFQPIVTINATVGKASAFTFGSVELDNEIGAFEAIQYLIGLGHRRIAYLAGHLYSASDQQRRNGYLRALEHAEINFDPKLIIEIGGQIATEWPDFKAGYEQCLQLLSTTSDIDAIVTFSDMMAIGALAALKSKDISVPETISILSFDKTSLGQYSIPQLTSVGVDLKSLGSKVFEILNYMMEENTQNSAFDLHQKLKPSIKFRTSVFDRRIS